MISRYWTPAFAGVTSKGGVIQAKALHHMVFRAKAGIQELKNVQTNMAIMVLDINILSRYLKRGRYWAL